MKTITNRDRDASSDAATLHVGINDIPDVTVAAGSATLPPLQWERAVIATAPTTQRPPLRRRWRSQKPAEGKRQPSPHVGRTEVLSSQCTCGLCCVSLDIGSKVGRS
jgi:hypothetical protein